MTSRPVEETVPVPDDPTPEVAPELMAGLRRMGELLGRGDLEGAYAQVKDLERHWPENERVQHYTRVLAPSTARVVPGEGRSFEKHRAWLREHAHRYPGCWLAVLDDQLIAADPDAAEVMAAARRGPNPRHTVLHYQPRREE